ncbi:MAG: uroporphyrinogen decarboxylase family protein [Anaerolineae bacterium]
MQPRERYLETVLFGHPDHIPFIPGWPRESTLAAWHTQGLDPAVNFLAALAGELQLPHSAFESTISLPVSTRMNPTFEEQVLAHENGHYIVRDWMGAVTEIADTYDNTYIRTAKDFVTRKWHRFPVQGPADWEQLAWRYRAGDADRYPADWAAYSQEVKASGLALVISLNGPFWQMREWLGMEGLCLMMADQPEFIAELTRFWQRFTCEVLEETLRHIRVDAVQLSEDMAYKAHSMISPAMARRFLLPTYQAWHELTRSYGCPIIDMDSDGEVSQLIPLWVEAGINVSDPMEVAAGNDIVAERQRWGTRMAFKGGLDKRALAAGGDEMCGELERVVPPLLELGGFIPSCDHGVPPDISWPNYIAYSRYLAQLLGWL